MRIVSVIDLQPGQVLARPVHNERGDCLLNSNVPLTGRYIEFLRSRGFTFVFVDDVDTADIDLGDVVSERVRINATRSLFHFYTQIDKATQHLRDKPTEVIRTSLNGPEYRERAADVDSYERLCEDVEDVIDEVLRSELLAPIASVRSHDNYTFFHSIDVAVIAVMLGKRLYLDRQRLAQLAKGCVLHDVGMTFVERGILDKPDPLTIDEWKRIRQHPALGYDLLRRLPNADPVANHVAYQHHERQDGQGYPRGLTGSNRIQRETFQRSDPAKIHHLAEICAVANVFDALRSNRPFRPALSPEQVVQTLREMAGRALNRELVNELIEMLPLYPLGTDVLIETGEFANHRGVVARNNPSAPDRPVIRVIYDPNRRRIDPVELNLAASDARISSTMRELSEVGAKTG